MKNLLFICLVFLGSLAHAQHLKKDGTPDMRYKENRDAYPSNYNNGQKVYKTRANNTNLDNYSTEGNTNPYTGKKGRKPADYSQRAQELYNGHVVYTGKRGGHYYINSKGKKVYLPKG